MTHITTKNIKRHGLTLTEYRSIFASYLVLVIADYTSLLARTKGDDIDSEVVYSVNEMFDGV